MKVTVNVNGQEQELEVTRQGDRLRISYGGATREVRVLYTDGAHFVLEYEQQSGEFVQQRRLRAAGHVEGDQRQLWVNGSTIFYERVREKQAGAGPAAAGSLSTSIPAVVSEILVAEGDLVNAGDKLILLESMKMILPVQAPHDGVVVEINCTAGEAVQPGVPLLELKTTEETDE